LEGLENIESVFNKLKAISSFIQQWETQVKLEQELVYIELAASLG
jgi:hypothetical protein